ncbi:MAG: 4Fe-4S binding protein [Planctomycetota bacterium]|nr:4Fe-4S binding protein [Planctomycetota bacterium]
MPEKNASKEKEKAEDKFLVIKKEWCKRCGICISICPKQVIERLGDGTVEIVHLERCISCGLCVMHCPDYAIFGDPEELKEAEGQ